MTICDFCEAETIEPVEIAKIFLDIKIIICNNCYTSYKMGEGYNSLAKTLKCHETAIKKIIQAFNKFEDFGKQLDDISDTLNEQNRMFMLKMNTINTVIKPSEHEGSIPSKEGK